MGGGGVTAGSPSSMCFIRYLVPLNPIYSWYLWLAIQHPAEPRVSVGECFAAVLKEPNGARGDVINVDALARADTSLPAAWCIGVSRTPRWTFSLASRLMNKTSVRIWDRTELVMDHETYYSLWPSAENTLFWTVSCFKPRPSAYFQRQRGWIPIIRDSY